MGQIKRSEKCQLSDVPTGGKINSLTIIFLVRPLFTAWLQQENTPFQPFSECQSLKGHIKYSFV
ncbi:MAG: hypothetical protein CML22_05090 [Rheinheimera sp.]|nr:hypothetical protein [Rheinheimera sp.]